LGRIPGVLIPPGSRLDFKNLGFPRKEFGGTQGRELAKRLGKPLLTFYSFTGKQGKRGLQKVFIGIGFQANKGVLGTILLII